MSVVSTIPDRETKSLIRSGTSSHTSISTVSHISQQSSIHGEDVNSGIGKIWFIRLQVFVVGAAIMALELTASRILAPEFGDSIFAWGSLIGVVLTALSLGYMAGGRLADRKLSYGIFCATILVAGALTLIIPYSSPMIIELVLTTGLGIRYGPVVVTALLMGPPTFLLGIVAPYSIKLATKSLSHLGNVSGSLYSISTFGSIVGTFGTVFILIPEMGVRSIITLVGVSLMAVSLPGLTTGPRIFTVAVVAVVVSPVSSLLQGGSLLPGQALVEKDTPYSHLMVKDTGGKRILFLNGMPDSAMYLNDSVELAFPYTRYFAMGWALNPDISKVLFVGGGGFSGPKKFLRDYPVSQVNVVEIDPDVIEVARRYFGVQEDPRLRIYNQDGRTYLGHNEERYDLIVLDAYTKTYVPFHLMTREFFEELSDSLSPEGVIVSNLISSLVGDTSELFWAEYRTVKQVFPSLYVFKTGESGPGWVQNVILAASKEGVKLDRRQMLLNLDQFPSEDSGELKGYVGDLWDQTPDLASSPVLTDDYSPVEDLLNPITGETYDIELEAGTRRKPENIWAKAVLVAIILSASLAAAWFLAIRPSFRNR